MFEGFSSHLNQFGEVTCSQQAAPICSGSTAGSFLSQAVHAWSFPYFEEFSPLAGRQRCLLPLCLDRRLCGAPCCSCSSGTPSGPSGGPHLGPGGPLCHLEDVANEAEDQDSHQRFPAFL